MAAKKKRGVKPGTKRGPYRKLEPDYQHNEKYIYDATTNTFDRVASSSVGNLPSLISDLASTIDILEAQLTAQIDRIKSILK